MNEGFPPKAMAPPQFEERKGESGRRPPLTPEQLSKRTEIARILGGKVQALNKQLQTLTGDQRKAVVFKVTHDGPIDFGSTGLKPLVDRSEHVTLVIPRQENLDTLAEKIDEFEAEEPKGAGFLTNQDFVRIEDFERGEPKDRLSDDLLEDYEELVKADQVVCEIELMTLLTGSKQRREQLAEYRNDLKAAFASGVHGTIFEQEERGPLCRVVVRCKGPMFQKLVEEDRWQRSISWFDSRPKFETFHQTFDSFSFQKLGATTKPSDDAPTICIVDSGLSPGNPFLEPVSREDLFKSYLKEAPEDPYDAVGHGSGVASLAAYHSLNLSEGAENQAKAWIASARILDASNQIEDERLLSKLVEEVVKDFVPLGVRIFNLSVADLGKRWNQSNKRTQPRNSWTARTLDRLSREYDIVFVVATGNVLIADVLDHLKSGKDYPGYLCDEDSRILDPGQASLALSVGSISGGTLVTNSSDRAIALQYHPSPFTRSGPGIKMESKPDVVEVGGNLTTDTPTTWVRQNPGTDVMMASNKLSPAIQLKHGTSFAAPRVANKLAVILHELEQLGLKHITAPLLKAFLVNCCSYRPEMNGAIEQLDAVGKKRWLDVLGHGFPDVSKATECNDYSAILFYQGELEANQIAFFDVPVPVELAASSNKKRITITVVHNPQVQNWGLESYLGIDLKWRLFRGDVDRSSVVEAMSKPDEEELDAREAEDQESPGELRNFKHKIQLRSRGTIQHDWFEWTNHRAEFSANHYTLAVGSHKRWNRNVEPTKFALVVRIEDLGAETPIYSQIASEIDLLVKSSIRT